MRRTGSKSLRTAGESRTHCIKLLVECNTFVDCGITGVEIEPGTTAIIERNLIHGQGIPCSIHPARTKSAGAKTGHHRM